ncbi:F-box protein [Quillaja saponaria]|uniref:F-box protein n=1 Tax=Quillaja saponaria TaxID=32244 RepID=A0AAD7L472_QUISA|nr:F-box protein [Quillaja saponaria]
MENLPRDIALDIFSRLPITSFLQIKSVCRTWRALSQDPSLPTMFQARANERNPSLILHCDSPILNKLCFVGYDQGQPGHYSNKVLKIDARLKLTMPEYHLVGSCNGLLCVADAFYYDPVCIFNPFTSDYIELPKTHHHTQQEVALGFGYHSITMEYKMVRVVYYGTIRRDLILRRWSEHSEVQIFTLGTDAWRSLGSIRWRLDQRPSEAMVNGALHWVTTRHKGRRGARLHIISFDLAEEKFKEIVRPGCGSLDICNFHLLVLGESLSAAICQTDGGLEIWVMKVYNVRESWTKDYIIGAYVPASVENRQVNPNSRIWKYSTLSKRLANEVVCVLKNGEILLEYESGALVLYNPYEEEFKKLVISGLPKWFATLTHVDSIFSLEAALKIKL